MMEYGKLFLIPSFLGENEPDDVLPRKTILTACSLDCFVVEELRTARRFLSAIGLRGRMEDIEFHELNEHTPLSVIESYLYLFENGRNVGLISEAGLPAVADPGAVLVAVAHSEGIEVVPLVGPSSLMLALMASGMNGQSFAFCGYLPVKADERKRRLKEIEKLSVSSGQSQIFIETPYRNDSMLSDILMCCRPSTMLSIAADITMHSETICSKPVSGWAKAVSEGFRIGKRPCVFVLSASNVF